MLDHSYPYYPSNTSGVQQHKGHAVNCVAFYFDTDVKNRRYFMELVELEHGLHIVKFYPDQYKYSAHRYNLIANDHNSFMVLGTCVKILLNELLLLKPHSSFLFHGVPKLKKAKRAKKVENFFTAKDYNETQRFRIYKYAIINRLGRQAFELEHDPSLSLMCVLRRTQLTPEFREYTFRVAATLTSELGHAPVFTSIDF